MTLSIFSDYFTTTALYNKIGNIAYIKGAIETMPSHSPDLLILTIIIKTFFF